MIGQGPTLNQATIYSTAPATSASQSYWSHICSSSNFSMIPDSLVTYFCCAGFSCCFRFWDSHTYKGNTSKPSLSKETTEAAKTAPAAAINAAKASLEMLNSKNEERRYFEALMKCLDIQVAEMRSTSNLIWKLEGAKEAAMPSHKQPEQYIQHPSKSDVQQNGTSSVKSSVRPSSATASTAPLLVSTQDPIWRKSMIHLQILISHYQILTWRLEALGGCSASQ